MLDYIELGSTPSGENCVQVGKPGYYPEMRKECQCYRDYLRRLFPIPDDLKMFVDFRIKDFPHDFGTYCEVVIRYHDNIPEAIDFALNVEDNLPEHWPKYNQMHHLFATLSGGINA